MIHIYEALPARYEIVWVLCNDFWVQAYRDKHGWKLMRQTYYGPQWKRAGRKSIITGWQPCRRHYTKDNNTYREEVGRLVIELTNPPNSTITLGSQGGIKSACTLPLFLLPTCFHGTCILDALGALYAYMRHLRSELHSR